MNKKNKNMELMKAVTQYRYGGPQVLNIENIQKPSPNNNEILIRIHSTPIAAAGSFMREGTPYIGRLAIGIFKPKSNIPGVGFSGEIEAIGSEVNTFNIGDKVFGETLFSQGTQAEYVCVPQDDVISIKPENITHNEASPICDGHITSLNFLSRVTNLKAGQSILINGASGALGTAAVQIAVIKGAKVTGVCSSANVELVRSLGAHHVIDYTKTDFTQGTERYDVIYDTIGKSSFGKCKQILTEEGTYMSPVLNFTLLCLNIWTSMVGKKKAKFSATGMLPKQELKEMLEQITTWIKEDKMYTFIDRKYTLDQAAEAHAYVDTGRKKGNVVLTINH